MHIALVAYLQKTENFPITAPVMMANMSLIARTRAASTIERQFWIEAFNFLPKSDQARLTHHLLQVKESLFWEQHRPLVCQRPLLPRFAVVASIPLADQSATKLGDLLIRSFMICENIQSFKDIDYQYASRTLSDALSSWQAYRLPVNSHTEGFKILSAFRLQCDVSKNEKMHLLAKFIELLPVDYSPFQRLAAQAHFLGFLFANRTRVLFEPRRFLDTVESLYRIWISSKLSRIDQRQNFLGYYHQAFTLYKNAGRSIEELERFAIDCLWQQRHYNLSVRPERCQKKIVVMGAFSLASLTALIEALVAGYSVLVEKTPRRLSSPKRISITESSMIEALYRYGIAYPILMKSGVENFPVSVLKSDLKQFFYQVALSLNKKIQEQEKGVCSVDFFEANSLQFVVSTGLVSVTLIKKDPCKAIIKEDSCKAIIKEDPCKAIIKEDSCKAIIKEVPCEAMILGGSRKAERTPGFWGLWFRPSEWLYRDDDRQLMVVSERAFFLAGTKITAFLVGGMEHQEVNVDRDKSGIASTRHLPLFGPHWSSDRMNFNEAFFQQELCTASMERWLGQSLPIVFPKLVKPTHVPASLLIEKCLYLGLINEYQSNIFRTLSIVADPELATSLNDALPLGNASKIVSTLKNPICDLANQEIDAVCEHLAQFITLKYKNFPPKRGFSQKINDARALIEYLKLQKEFIGHVLSKSPAMNS